MSPLRERTLAGDLEEAARVGRDEGGGVTRFAWTPELAAVTAWVSEELERLGLQATNDEAGNMIARWPGVEGQAVMVASHLDTVPNGGRFDGVLGVLAALEAIRILRSDGFEPRRPIWVGSFMDEEGARFGAGLFGSRAFCGRDVSAALQATDQSGLAMADAMREAGFDPDKVGDAARVHEVGAYLELHIEQGPMLHESGRRLGVVETIAGALAYRVRFEGVANHAGSTPVELRRDAVVGAAKVVLALREEAQRQPGLRTTVGRLRAYPGATNVIPGACEFSIDMRPATPELFDEAEALVGRLLEQVAEESRLTYEVRQDYAVPPAIMAPQIVDRFVAAAEAEGVEPFRMFSGAGHDAMLVAKHAPAGMIFVPSRDGVSHSPDEWTDTEDCELGARVLARVLAELASSEDLGEVPSR